MKYKIYCDLDGVLAGYSEGIKSVSTPSLIQATAQKQKAELVLKQKLSNEFSIFEQENSGIIEDEELVRKFVKSLKDTPMWNLPEVKAFKKADNIEKGIRYSLTGKGFYRNLPEMPDMNELILFVSRIDPNYNILTAPMSGKPEEIQNCCNEKLEWVKEHIPSFSGQFICDPDKAKYATPEKDVTKILIDDRSKNSGFQRNGNIFVLHTNASDTIEKLKKILGMNENLNRFVNEIINNEFENMLVKFAGKISPNGKINSIDEAEENETKKSVSYTAVVLNEKSRNKILSAIQIPEGFEPLAHHMTVNMGSWKGERNKLGAPIELKAVSLAQDDKVIAVGVETPIQTTNKIPHVTVGVNRNSGGKPVMSNKLTTWELLSNPIELEGTLEEVSL